jgi:hypothetical protein
MARAHRNPPEPKPPQLLADAALVQAYRECRRNLLA